jgi:exodeoxyribonuclease I
MSFIFYDTETTGTDTWFDQILQLAAIKTDAEFNEIDRLEIRCRPLEHIVPSPGAMTITGVRATQLSDVSLCSHYEMIRTIREKLLSWSPATFIGYNSLEFDEDLLRQALYKTLHQPYLTNTNGNARSDAFRMAHACNLFAPQRLVIPINDDGEQVFKLDRLAPANGFAHDRAHDAMGDVEATIHICRLMSESAPEVWSSFMRFSRKPAVVDYITAEPIFCISEIYFGRAYSYLVTSIGQDTDNPNEWYLYDLAVDPDSLIGLTQEELEIRLGRWPKPFKTTRSNAVPILFSADDAPDCSKAKEHGPQELERRARLLQENTEFRDRLIATYRGGKKQYPPSPYIERQIYDGFFNEQNLMDAFHSAPWEHRPAILERFTDERLKAIGWRLLHAERPDLMEPALRDRHDMDMAHRIAADGKDVPWLTIPKALADLDEMLVTASSSEALLLTEHRIFLAARLNDAMQRLSPTSEAVA